MAGPARRARVQGAQAIDRAIDVLELLVSESECGVTDVANALDLTPGTTHRILRALTERGYLQQDAATDRYHLGPSAVVLSQAARSSLGVDRALPVIEALSALTGESVNLGIRDRHEVVVVLRVASEQPLRFVQPVGTRRPLHASSMGKTLLAFGPDNRLDPGLEEMDLVAVTDTTVTSRAALRRELEQVRVDGFSTDGEESVPGVSCMGAPVLDAGGRATAAIAVQAPTVRMQEADAEALADQIRRAATEVSEVLGLHMGHLERAPTD